MTLKPSPNRGGRLEWLDALKGFAIFAVVLGHVLLGYVENNAFPEENQRMKAIMQWIYIWHMPLFFAISGYAYSLSCLKDGKADIGKIRKKAINLLIIYLFFSIALGGLKIIFSAFVDNPMDITELLKGIIFPNTLMWYLWVLILFYLVFPKVAYMNPVGVSVVMATLFLFGRYMDKNIELRLCFRNFLCCAAYFYMGIYLQKGKRKEGLEKLCFGAVVILGLLYFLFYNRYRELPVLTHAVIEGVYAAAVIVAAFSGFSFGVKREICLCKAGKASMVIYLLHTYIVTAVKVAVIRSGFGSAVMAITGTWLIAVLTTCVIWYISNKVRWIGFFFHPLEKSEK